MPRTNALTPKRGVSGRAVAMRVCAVVLVLSAWSAGCLRGQAKALPEVPLEMPAPPPRVVEVIDPTTPPIVSLPEEPVRNTPPRPRPAPLPRADVRPPETRPEPVDPPKPAEEATRTSPAPALQTAPAQQEGEAERRIRGLLEKAAATLNRINVLSLNAEARQQFDTARRFVTQAEDAIRTRNLVFAGNLADKAAALADQLSGR